jgi:hypothetical protein
MRAGRPENVDEMRDGKSIRFVDLMVVNVQTLEQPLEDRKSRPPKSRTNDIAAIKHHN